MRRKRTIEFAVGLVLLSVLVGAAAGWAKDSKPAGPPPDAVLTWNTYAVNAVRSSTPTKVQTVGSSEKPTKPMVAAIGRRR